MTRQEYLFSCILRDYDEDFAMLTCDEQYDNTPRLYKEFEKSPFNEKNQPIEDCVERYLLDRQANQNDELDINADSEFII